MSGVPSRVERRRGRPAEELQWQRDELRREWERRNGTGGGEQGVSAFKVRSPAEDVDPSRRNPVVQK